MDLVAGGAEVNDEVAPLFSADGFSPPHFHEIAGLGVGVGGEVDTAFEVGEDLGGAGAVGIPAAEYFFAVFDVKVGKTGELFYGEKGRVLEAELLNDAEKDEVSGTGAKGFSTGLGVLNNDAIFEGDAGGEAIDGLLGGLVTASTGHGFDGDENVLIEGRRLLDGLDFDSEFDLSAGGKGAGQGEEFEKFAHGEMMNSR